MNEFRNGDKFRNCETLEDIMSILILDKEEEGDALGAAKRCLVLGLINDAKDFYILSKQKKYMEEINKKS